MALLWEGNATDDDVGLDLLHVDLFDDRGRWTFLVVAVVVVVVVVVSLTGLGRRNIAKAAGSF